MTSRTKLVGILLAVMLVAVGTVYAATVNNPGDVSFTSNGDSKIQSAGGGGTIWVNHGNELILGTIDSSGAMDFAQADITFDANTDANGYTALLNPISAGTGTFCPNSGAATISMAARLKITKVAGVSISTTPCFIALNSGSAFTLTTGTSGSLTGASFKDENPKFVAQIPLGTTVTGTCTSTQKSTIASYYGISGGTHADLQLFDAAISPTDLTGDGC
jgi:hypothetical protein